MKYPKVLLAVLAATPFLSVIAQGQGGGEYHDLSKDQFVAGGLTPGVISKELLPAFAGYAPKERSDEVIVFAFNYDVPKLQLAYRDSSGKVKTRTGKLAKGEKLLATINSKSRRGGVWIVDATVRWAKHCGNPLPSPFKVTLWIPDWSKDRLDIQCVEVPAPYAVTVKENVIVQQLVPTIGDISISIPLPTEQPRHRLTVLGHEEAGRRWEYQKDFWDGFLDFLKVVAYPIGQLIRRADNISIATATSSQGGAGGAGGSVGPITNNNSNSNANSNANNVVVNTGSGSAAGSAAGYASGSASAGNR